MNTGIAAVLARATGEAKKESKRLHAYICKISFVPEQAVRRQRILYILHEYIWDDYLTVLASAISNFSQGANQRHTVKRTVP